MVSEKNLQTETLDIPDWKDVEDYQKALYDAHEHNDPDELEFFLLHRPKAFEGKKLRGEDELIKWLQESFEEKYGPERKPMVGINKKGIIVPTMEVEQENK